LKNSKADKKPLVRTEHLSRNTYRWIIGCLSAVIIILLVYLILRENDIIKVPFSESFSLASTISSLLLSVIAIFYTYYSGKDTEKIQGEIQTTVRAVNTQVEKANEMTQNNANLLQKVEKELRDVLRTIDSVYTAAETIKSKDSTEEEKKRAFETIDYTQRNMDSTRNSMMMFLKMMEDK